jgi:hypothetical protein
MRSIAKLVPRAAALGLVVLMLPASVTDAAAQVTVRISDGMTVRAYDVDITLAGTIEATGTLDTRGSTITFTQTDGTGGITLGGGLAIELTDSAGFQGSTINGPVQIQGTLRLTVAPDTDIDQGATFTVLTCAGGCSGQFDQVQAPFAVDVDYTAAEVTVTALEGFTTPTQEGPATAQPVVLHAPYPNPFSDGTTFRLDLDRQAQVRVEVYDVLGRRVGVVVEGPLAAGTHMLRWSAPGLGSGSYVVVARLDDMAIGAWRMTLAR